MASDYTMDDIADAARVEAESNNSTWVHADEIVESFPDDDDPWSVGWTAPVLYKCEDVLPLVEPEGVYRHNTNYDLSWLFEHHNKIEGIES